MQITSRDAICRYIPAPGSSANGSPFGRYLSDLGVELERPLDLELMIARGWVHPMLRVILPREALDAWRNYPEPSVETEGFPPNQVWAVNLCVHAATGAWPNRSSTWWIHELDDPANPLAQAARANAVNPSSPQLRPPPFRHLTSQREIRPWMDYFAYWQVFQIVEYSRSMMGSYALTENPPADTTRVKESREEWVRAVHQGLEHRWAHRVAAFDWLSRMRTVLGARVSNHRSWDDQESAIQQVAITHGLTAESMKADVRETLLGMWSEWSGKHSLLKRSEDRLLHLLRQEIEYAIHYVEVVSGKEVDFLDDFWSPTHRSNHSARLIEALPREQEQARRDFPWDSESYLQAHCRAIPSLADLDRKRVRDLISTNWRRSRPLRRFVLAFRRLHEQLGGEQLLAEDGIIREAERIEQFILIVMHAERLLSEEVRERTKGQRFPDVRPLARDGLNHVLGAWNLLNGGFSATVQPLARTLMDRGQLHNLEQLPGLPLIAPEDVQSGKPIADHIVAAFVNFVIIRNYAAHHDSLDFDLVYPRAGQPGDRHPGKVSLESVLLVVLSTLLTR